MRNVRHPSVLAAAALAALTLGGRSAHATLVPFQITSPGTSVAASFAGFNGTAASLPANFATSGADNSFTGNTFTDGSSTYTTANGIYAGANTTNSDIGFVARVPIGAPNLQLTFAVTNNTGGPLSSLSVSWYEAQYQDATATPNTIGITADDGTGGTAFDTTNLTATQGTLSHNEWQAGGTTTVYATPLEGPPGGSPVLNVSTYTPAGGATIPNGATVEFQYQWVAGGGGNRPIFGVQDVSISGTAVNSVPEPASLGLIGVAASLLAGRRRTA